MVGKCCAVHVTNNIKDYVGKLVKVNSIDHGVGGAIKLSHKVKIKLKELEMENSRLKRMYADVQLDAQILKEALAKKW